MSARLVALIMIMCGADANAACLKYPPAHVTITGTISQRADFGPPNYGEDPKTDSREEHFYLRLDKPVCVAAAHASDFDDVNVAEKNIATMQMLYFTKEKFQKSWLGKHVSVTGTLFHGISAHHWTPVLIEPTETKLVSP